MRTRLSPFHAILVGAHFAESTIKLPAHWLKVLIKYSFAINAPNHVQA
jgi:hypothetical protein